MSEFTVRAGKLTVKRTARYFSLEGAGADATSLWIVLHGYGQRAADFIEGFRVAARPDRLIVAPEGLSRFYRRGMDGAVGASWMTSADREAEIDDYVGYLDQLHREVAERFALENPELHILGFSQGAATAARWAMMGEKPSGGRLTLWSGGWPPDLQVPRPDPGAQDWQISLVYGPDDPYIDAAQVRDIQQKLEAANQKVTTHRFEGGHRLDDDILKRLAGQE